MAAKIKRDITDPATYRDQWGRPLAEIPEVLSREFGLREVKPFRTDLYGDYAYFKAFHESSPVFVKWGGYGQCCRTEFEFNDRLYAQNQRNFNRPFFCRCDSSYKCLYLEFLEGENLEDLVLEKRLGEAEAAIIIPQLLEISEALFRAGCVHRGVKLKNFVYTPDKRLVLIDFQYAVDAAAYAQTCREQSPLDGFGLGNKFYWDDTSDMLKLLRHIGRPAQAPELYDRADAYFKANLGRLSVSYPGRRLLLFKRAFFKALTLPLPPGRLRHRLRKLYLPPKFRY